MMTVTVSDVMTVSDDDDDGDDDSDDNGNYSGGRWGECTLIRCEEGYIPHGNRCHEMAIACTLEELKALNAVIGNKIYYVNGDYGPCVPIRCQGGRTLGPDNRCYQSTIPCREADLTGIDANATEGNRTYNKVAGFYETCQITACAGNRILNSRTHACENCPGGFVAVLPLADYTLRPFCIAKYEMKQHGDDVASAIAHSVAEGLPWVEVTRDEAKDKCDAIGNGYRLVNNNEWQTVARHIAGVAENWSDGNVDITDGGYLNRGYVGSEVGEAVLAGLDSTPCLISGDGLALGECSDTKWHDLRRTHLLPGGQWIWDLSGNTWEWMADDNSVNHGKTDGTEDEQRAYNEQHIAKITSVLYQRETGLLGGVLRNVWGHFGPARDFTGFTSAPYGGLGFAWLGQGSSHTIKRGGYFNSSLKGGLFSVDLSTASGDEAGESTGFRCVYRHP